MLPLLEIEKVNQKSAVKTQNSKNVNEGKNESDGFAEIFNFLSSDKNVKKSEIKSKNIPSNVEVDLQNTATLLKNKKNQSNILKSLDEKYNLSRNFLDSQKTEVQTENIKTKFFSNSSLSLPTNMTLKNAKDLLEFSKAQKQETKTLKDLSKVADDLKLNVQKISMQKGEENQDKNIKTLMKQEILPLKQVLAINESSKESLNTNAMQKINKESPSILSSLLQDKELINKESSKKTSKVTPIKTDSKAEKVLNPKIQEEKKEKKTLKNSKILENVAQKLEDKADKTSKVTPIKTDSKAEKVLNPKIQEEKKEEKVFKDSKKTEVVESKIQEKSVFNKNEQSKEVLAKKTQGKEEKVKNPIQEQPVKSLESPQQKNQNPIPQESIKQEVSKEESLKESPREFAKKEANLESIEQEKVIKEVAKESQSNKTTNPTKVTQDSTSNPFVLREKKEIKDSLVKEEKEDKGNIKNSKDSIIRGLNRFSSPLKEENIKQDLKQQDIFLDNLLKTSEKLVQSPKEVVKEAVQERNKENLEKKSKVNQEVYQATTQTQVESRFSAQNTFLHFSDKLREALQNYRPPITKLSLELNPEKLGSVELTITKRGDNISVQISSNQNALQLFMQNAQEFKNSLSNLGFNDVNLDFKDNAGNSLGSGDFGGSSGREQGGFSHQQREENPQEKQNLEQDFNENPKNIQSWNENSLHFYKEVNNPYAKVALVEINFSYYA